MIKIGVIADDFTGATDIASFLVENGLPTVQINGVPTGKMPEAIDALVISLKTRSCTMVEATQQSLAALIVRDAIGRHFHRAAVPEKTVIWRCD